MLKVSYWGALLFLGGLIVLCLAWELWLAPLRPGGSWLALKALVATLPLPGLLYGRRYTFQWASMFILLYFFEGVMRAWADRFPANLYALTEAVLAAGFFISAVIYCRYSAAK